MFKKRVSYLKLLCNLLIYIFQNILQFHKKIVACIFTRVFISLHTAIKNQCKMKVQVHEGI